MALGDQILGRSAALAATAYALLASQFATIDYNPTSTIALAKPASLFANGIEVANYLQHATPKASNVNPVFADYSWRFYGLANRPSTIQSVANKMDGKTKLPAPFGYRFGFPTIGNQPVPSAVAGLLFSSCPSTITRLVIAVGIDSIKASFWWTRSHISQEIGKLKPSIADRNASAAIKLIAHCFRIVASLMHAAPSKVSWRCRFAVWSMPMLREFVAVQASATLSNSVTQASRNDNKLFAARAPAIPCSAFSISRLNSGWCWRKHSESAECHSGKIDIGWHTSSVLVASNAVNH